MSKNPDFEKITSKEEILQVLSELVEENLSENKILVTLNSLVAHFQIKKDKDIHPHTFRRYGVNPDGYFIKKYPEVFDYKTDARSNRGLIIEVEKFVETFEDLYDENILEDIKEDLNHE